MERLIRWFVERDLMVLFSQNSLPLSVLTTVKTDTWSATHTDYVVAVRKPYNRNKNNVRNEKKILLLI